MKKMLIIISIILVVLIMLCIGMITKLIPIPFLDSKDSICRVTNKVSDDLSIKTEVVVKYDFLAKAKTCVEVNKYMFKKDKTSEEIDSYSDGVIGMIEDKPVEIKKTSRSIELIYNVETKEIIGKAKKQATKYIEETGYECSNK